MGRSQAAASGSAAIHEMATTIQRSNCSVVLVIGGLVSANIGPLEGLRFALGRTLAFQATSNLLLGAFTALVAAWVLARFLPETRFGSRMILLHSPPRPR